MLKNSAILLMTFALLNACGDQSQRYSFNQTDTGDSPAPERGVVETESEAFGANELGIYRKLLKSYVDTSDHNHFIRYRAWTENREDQEKLLNLVKAVEKHDYLEKTENERLAFLINAYNVLTLHLLINMGATDSNADGISDQNFYEALPSPKTIFGITEDVLGVVQTPWKHFQFVVGGTRVTLDQLEHGDPSLSKNEYIRGYNDPRIHFAVNCASVGCPPLLDEPYVSTTLQDQLDKVTIEFVNNGRDTDLSFDQGGTLRIRTSEILNWFSDDWTSWSRSIGNVVYKGRSGFFTYYLDSSRHPQLDRAVLATRELLIIEGSYDWDLNESVGVQ